MESIVLLLVMASVPLLLFMATKRRVRKDESWKFYAGAAGLLLISMVVVKVLGYI